MVKRVLQGLAMDGHAHHSILCHLIVSKANVSIDLSAKNKQDAPLPLVVTCFESESFEFTSSFTLVKMSYLQHNVRLHVFMLLHWSFLLPMGLI